MLIIVSLIDFNASSRYLIEVLAIRNIARLKKEGHLSLRLNTELINLAAAAFIAVKFFLAA